jgi:hypothetical protein
MTTTTTTNDKTETRKRGRKPLAEGGTSTPRKVIVICHAGKTVESIELDGLSKEDRNEDILAKAKEQYKAKHGSDCSVLGPFWPRHGVAPAGKKRDSVAIPLEDLEFTREKASAIYKDWEVAVKGLKGRQDAVWCVFKKHLSDPKKVKPAAKCVLRSALQNIKPLEAKPAES